MGSGADWDRCKIPGTLKGFAVDLPGHGLSIDLPSEAYEFSNVADGLLAALNDAGISEMDLVGYSMGGRVALEFAWRFPNLVRNLVIESTSPGLSSEEAREKRAESDAAWAEQLRTDRDLFHQKWLAADLFSSIRKKPEIMKILICERRSGDAREWARALEGLGQARQRDFRPWLADTNIKLTCISGALDQKYTEIASELSLKNERIRHITVPDAGHNVHLERPEMYLQTLQDILAD